MSIATFISDLIRVGNLGRSIGQPVANGKVEIIPSTDAGNPVKLSPNDGGVMLDVAKTKSLVLPAVTAAQVGSTLGVKADGTWDVNPFSGPIQSWPAFK